jgi:TRAP-type mannitol/chloroaromatic compound transport system permease small subunit
VFGIVKYACVVILAALVAVVFSIFFGRYVLSRSPIWGEPFSLLCLVWMSLLGSALVVRRNEHLRVTMFDERLGEKGVFLDLGVALPSREYYSNAAKALEDIVKAVYRDATER